MPFLVAPRELRDRVRNAAIASCVAFGVCCYFADEIFDVAARQPLFTSGTSEEARRRRTSCSATLTEPFWVDMSIALWAGIFAASPFIFYQLWKFIAPGLYKRERRITVAFAVFSGDVLHRPARCFATTSCSRASTASCSATATQDLQPMLLMQDYLDLTRDMMLAFGAVFELPLLIYFLAMVGHGHPSRAVEVQPLVHRDRVHRRRDPDAVTRCRVADPDGAADDRALQLVDHRSRGASRSSASAKQPSSKRAKNA